MISFFRKIRHNLMETGKTSRYLKYAIGEILLVMIGILLALQVNNWNEGRKARNAEKELVQNILDDLHTDRLRFTETIKQTEPVVLVYEQLYQFGVQGKTHISIESPHSIRAIPFFDKVLNTDFSELGRGLSNKTLREQLLKYDQEQKLLEVSFDEFRKIIVDKMRPFLREKGLLELDSIFNTDFDRKNFINQDKLKVIANEIAFQQLLAEAKLKMIGFRLRTQNLIQSNKKLTSFIDNKMTYYE